VEVAENTQNQLTRGLENGELDVAIMYDLDLLGTWRTATLAELQPRVVLPASHRLAGSERPVDLADLGGDPMVLDAPPNSSHAHECCAKAGFSPNVVYRAPRVRIGPILRRPWTRLDAAAPAAEVTYEGRTVVVVDIGSRCCHRWASRWCGSRTRC
jgi:DNA-binding transcriptional LysR family regulator